jgi:hypothetical protein
VLIDRSIQYDCPSIYICIYTHSDDFGMRLADHAAPVTTVTGQRAGHIK